MKINGIPVHICDKAPRNIPYLVCAPFINCPFCGEKLAKEKRILTWTGSRFVETDFDKIELNKNVTIRVVEKEIDASNPRFSGITETNGGDTQK